MKTHRLSLLLWCGLFSSFGLYASRDNAHFYRATNFLGEPRFERPALSTFDLYVSNGSTTTGFNEQRHKVPLFDIYGLFNMHEVGVGVPNKNLDYLPDIILEELALLPPNCLFGQLSCSGKFTLTELNAFYIQNLKNGFFLQLHVPVRFMRINNFSFCDLSPENCSQPNRNDPIWQAFLMDFNTILAQYCLNTGCIDNKGLGDISLQLGWALNYQDTDVLDFLDLTIRSGYLFSSSHKSNPNQVFDISLGYDGHPAIPLSLDFAFGTYDWLTLGAHMGALFFFNNHRFLHMKTDAHQSGWIKLASDHCVEVEKGTIWEAGGYLKADHVVHGLSLTFGYSYVTEQSDHLSAPNCAIFDPCVINSDQMFAHWKMHTLNLRAEYDFTTEESWIGPRITFFYDYPITGERIFRTAMIGGHCGVDIAWDLR